ncbi:TetR/AcrR family transcriptional regulator [Mycobacterium sp. 050134]|uniref:TetR/AcrR family transcriptional regulator n=1 Tax=Mycobacterium sp. 050134 TaxID=3096111 RepID=UPI002ED932B7
MKDAAGEGEMRYPPDHKQKARAALLQAGMRSMKVNGFNGVGVDGLAAAADVTSGAFYSNFPNKEAMLEAIVEAGVGEPLLSDTESGSKAERRAQLKKFLAEYLNADHVSDPAEGCVMPALSADVGRAGTAARLAYERKITAMAGRVADLLDGARADRERRAWSIVSLIVGAVSISRAMSDAASQAAVIAAAQRTVDKLVAPVKRP